MIYDWTKKLKNLIKRTKGSNDEENAAILNKRLIDVFEFKALDHKKKKVDRRKAIKKGHF